MKQTRGAWLAQRRKERGLTQAQLAEQLGVTDKAVSKWERDLSCPDIQSLPRLAEVLEVSVEQLLLQEAPPTAKTDGGEGRLPLILRAVALAMGVAAAVLSLLGAAPAEELCGLLGVGLAALAAERLQNK